MQITSEKDLINLEYALRKYNGILKDVIDERQYQEELTRRSIKDFKDHELEMLKDVSKSVARILVRTQKEV